MNASRYLFINWFDFLNPQQPDMKRTLIVFFLGILWLSASSQQTPAIGIDDQRPGVYAFTNATLYVDYNTVLEGASMVIQKGQNVGN